MLGKKEYSEEEVCLSEQIDRPTGVIVEHLGVYHSLNNDRDHLINRLQEIVLKLNGERVVEDVLTKREEPVTVLEMLSALNNMNEEGNLQLRRLVEKIEEFF